LLGIFVERSNKKPEAVAPGFLLYDRVMLHQANTPRSVTLCKGNSTVICNLIYFISSVIFIKVKQFVLEIGGKGND